ncbi:mRNA-decapping enzyme subunit 2 [Saitoella coloradoensis]
MAFASAKFEEVLDDLSVRFVINLPEEELVSVERICFQIEQAHWFYEDFVREENPFLPSLSLRTFTSRIFEHCPLLWKWSGQHEQAFEDFLTYKTRVPVRGAIMLNQTLDMCVLVKGWKSSSGWGFPKGKINKDEPDTDCAAREVYEETGYDVTPLMTAEDFIDITIREQQIRLYIVPGVPMETSFVPQTRKEISKVEWHNLLDLPTYSNLKRRNDRKMVKTVDKTGKGKFYMVIPFLAPLRNWIAKRKPAMAKAVDLSNLPAFFRDDAAAEAEEPIVDSGEATAGLKALLNLTRPGEESPAAKANENPLLAMLNNGARIKSVSPAPSQRSQKSSKGKSAGAEIMGMLNSAGSKQPKSRPSSGQGQKIMAILKRPEGLAAGEAPPPPPPPEEPQAPAPPVQQSPAYVPTSMAMDSPQRTSTAPIMQQQLPPMPPHMLFSPEFNHAHLQMQMSPAHPQPLMPFMEHDMRFGPPPGWQPPPMGTRQMIFPGVPGPDFYHAPPPSNMPNFMGHMQNMPVPQQDPVGFMSPPQQALFPMEPPVPPKPQLSTKPRAPIAESLPTLNTLSIAATPRKENKHAASLLGLFNNAPQKKTGEAPTMLEEVISSQFAQVKIDPPSVPKALSRTISTQTIPSPEQPIARPMPRRDSSSLLSIFNGPSAIAAKPAPKQEASAPKIQILKREAKPAPEPEVAVPSIVDVGPAEATTEARDLVNTLKGPQQPEPKAGATYAPLMPRKNSASLLALFNLPAGTPNADKEPAHPLLAALQGAPIESRDKPAGAPTANPLLVALQRSPPPPVTAPETPEEVAASEPAVSATAPPGKSSLLAALQGPPKAVPRLSTSPISEMPANPLLSALMGSRVMAAPEMPSVPSPSLSTNGASLISLLNGGPSQKRATAPASPETTLIIGRDAAPMNGSSKPSKASLLGLLQTSPSPVPHEIRAPSVRAPATPEIMSPVSPKSSGNPMDLLSILNGGGPGSSTPLPTPPSNVRRASSSTQNEEKQKSLLGLLSRIAEGGKI